MEIRITPREDDVLRALVYGADTSNRAIGRTVGMSESMVKLYLYRLARKISGDYMARVSIALWAERRWNDQSAAPKAIEGE